tara:strand:+ start:10007 stop:10900 length:894 start_codon:yes stop_codon:yes gene_type:complete
MVMMNIAKGAVSSVKALLKKKGLKDAVDVTTKKAKAVSSKAKEAVAKAKPKVDKAVQAVKTKAKPVTDKVKPAVEQAKAKVKPAVEKAKQTARAASVKARRKAGPKVRDTARRVARGTAAATGGALGMATGLAVAPTVASGMLGATTGFVSAKDPIKGAKVGGAIGGALGLAATAGLTASLIKSGSPKESKFTTQKMANGLFSTSFQDPSKNRVSSKKMLNDKDIADIKTQLAVLDSIVTSDDPKSQRSLFLQTVLYLNGKHGINMIEGNNLSIQLPTAGEVLIPSSKGLVGYKARS